MYETTANGVVRKPTKFSPIKMQTFLKRNQRRMALVSNQTEK
jgi:hypothetical protein